MNEKSFTVTELADYFRVSRSAVHKWIDKGELEAEVISPVSKRKLVRLSALRSFAETRRLDISGLVDRDSVRGTPCVAVV